MIYHYKRYSWCNGNFKGCVDLSITSDDFYSAHGKKGMTSFLLLLNAWNDSIACNGHNESAMIHKYVFVGCE